MARHPEDALFERFRERREPAVLAKVFDLVAADLFRIALHLCGRTADAEDVVQQTFLAAIERAASWDAARGLFPWLVGILTNQARLLRRAGARTVDPALLPQREVEGPSELAERAELDASITRAVEALGEIYRPVLHLHLYHGLNAKEIGAALGRPAGSVRTQLVRGLTQLRRALPVGLCVLAAASVGAGRGLAAVRQVVLRAGGEGAVVAAAGAAGVGTVVGGVFVMKKVFGVVAAVLLASFVWWSVAAPGTPEWTPGPVAANPAPVTADQNQVAERAVRASDGTPATRIAVATAPGSMRVRVVAKLAPDAGAKTQADGEPTEAPVAGCALQVWPGSSPLAPFDGTLRVVHTDLAGEARLSGLAPGPWRVLCAPDRDASSQEVVVEPGSEALVELVRKAVTVRRGIVVDPDGRPVAGAEVWAKRNEGGGRYGRDGHHDPRYLAARHAATSDAEGRFELALALGEITIGARKSGFAPSFGRYLDNRELRLVLGLVSATLSGIVRDTSGRPVCGALVCTTPASDGYRRAADGTVVGARLPQFERTDAQGRFAFGSLPPGKQTISAIAEPLLPAARDLDLAERAHAEVELTMADGIVVAGTVLQADGTPATGISLAAKPDRTLASGLYGDCLARADGTFTLTGIPARSFVVVVYGRASVEVMYREFTEPGAGMLRCDLVLPALPPLVGRVVDERGRPLSSWDVCALQGRGQFLDRTTTDAEGRFELRYVKGEGMRVVAYPADGDIDHPAVEQPVVPPLGMVLELRVPSSAMPRAMVTGRLTDGTGAALPARDLELRRADAIFHSPPRKHRSAADGTFQLGPCSAGKFEVRVADDGLSGGKLADLTLTHGEHIDLGNLSVRPRATLILEVTHQDGSPWPGSIPPPMVTDAAGKRVGATSVSGSTLHVELGAGRFRVEFPHVDLIAGAQEIELQPGETRTLRVAIGIGRSRRLVFNGDGTDRVEQDALLRVEVRRRDGEVVTQKDTRRVFFDRRSSGYWSLDHTFAFGRYEVTALAESGRRYKASFEVRENLEDPTRIDVPAEQ